MLYKTKISCIFVDRLIEFSQSGLDLSSFGISDRVEVDIISNTNENFNTLKDIYKDFYTAVGHNLHDYSNKLPIVKRESVDEDLRLN